MRQDRATVDCRLETSVYPTVAGILQIAFVQIVAPARCNRTRERAAPRRLALSSLSSLSGARKLPSAVAFKLEIDEGRDECLVRAFNNVRRCTNFFSKSAHFRNHLLNTGRSTNPVRILLERGCCNHPLLALSDQPHDASVESVDVGAYRFEGCGLFRHAPNLPLASGYIRVLQRLSEEPVAFLWDPGVLLGVWRRNQKNPAVSGEVSL